MLQNDAQNFTWPFLITHSPEDKLTPYPESLKFYQNAGSTDKSFDRLDDYGLYFCGGRLNLSKLTRHTMILETIASLNVGRNGFWSMQAKYLPSCK
jgi:hypothetical protein